ncbi:MAG: hypothetical protein L0212_08625, partial [Acidobacteria bacterium]|nr:hypothetical protein [Acidobacteriota bacterium]
VFQQFMNMLAWPVPFYHDSPHPWPFVEIDFHKVPRCVWPMAHLSVGLGYQKFLNWVYSFLASKIRTTSRDFLVCDASLAEDVRTHMERGDDLTLLEIKTKHGDAWEKLLGFLQHPQMNKDIWQIIELIEREFEKATGMSEIMYGETSRQLRSAQEAALKGDMARIRPDDMRNHAEAAMTLAARKEALMARWLLDAEDLKPVMGEDGAWLWEQLVMSTDVVGVAREFEFRVEAGSMAKPNKELDLANANEAAQFIFPVLMTEYQRSGNPTQVNQFLNDWAKARGMDPKGYMLDGFQMPMPMPPEGAAPPATETQGQAMR